MSNTNNRTEVQLLGKTLPNPVIPASGTFGFGTEMTRWFDLNILGGIALKGTTRDARFGNPTPRIAECEAGLLNAIGLENPGAKVVATEEIPRLRRFYNGVVIANVCGFSLDEYVEVAETMDNCDGVDFLEINISCPNVKHGGLAFGTSAAAAAEVCAAVRAKTKKPLLMKLSPNVTNVAEIALACEAAGADGLVLINTLLGMRLDTRTGKSVVAVGACGFSGPAVKPVALRMVFEVCTAVKVPVIGVGGIATADDVLDFISAGAAAVQVGSQNLVDPYACQRIIDALPGAMDAYRIADLQSIRGRAHA